MRRFILRIVGSFDPNSKYDWFLLIMMLYLGFMTLVLVNSPSEPPPPRDFASPFG